MSRATLVIMAAGIGSRFGGGIKQLAPVGPSGEIIMDYSIYDAVEAGFDKVVFVIRKDLEKDFREVIGNRIEKYVDVSYVFQELDDIPEKYKGKFAGRTKPWGTGQAILCCKDAVDSPFLVINADDYYGKEAFARIYDFLQGYTKEKPYEFSMAGFIMKNTLSDNGGVTRGIARVDENNYLIGVDETSNIVKTPDGAAVDKDGELIPVDAESYVSMNMWGLTPEYMDLLEEGFQEFFKHIEGNELKAEYLLPIHIDELLQAGKISVKVLDTKDKWFGVTYKEDKESVIKSFRKLLDEGVYLEDLFSDLMK